MKWSLRPFHSSDRRPLRRQNESSQVRGSSSASGEEPSLEVAASQFRRNRTISNAEKAPPSSLSPRSKTHHLRKQRRSIGGLLLMMLVASALLAAMVYQLIAQPIFSLYGSLDMLSEENQRAYRSTTEEYFARYPLERFRGLLQPQNLTTYLQQRGHEEVEEVKSTNFMTVGKTGIVIKVREPVAKWVIDGKVQYVDKNGSIFAKNYFKDPRIRIVDSSGVRVKNSQTVTSTRFLSFVGRSIGALARHGHTAKEVIIPPSTTRQAQVKLQDNTVVKLSIDRPVGEQAEDAHRALTYLAKQSRKISYIDVRVSLKAFYR